MSLLKMNSDLMCQAVDLFQLILRFTNADGVGQVSSEEEISIVTKIYEYSMKCPELKDELFVQIMKQTHNNPERTSLCKTWKLIYLCASAMCPGTEIASIFLDYIHDVVKAWENDCEMHTVVLTARNSLERSVKIGPRKFIPSREELEAILVGRKLKTIVFFLDETYEDITYDLTTTIVEAVQELAGIIKLSAYTTFGLFECRKMAGVPKSGKLEAEEYFILDKNKYVGDILAGFNAAKEQRKTENPQFKLVFKKSLFCDLDDSITEPTFVKLTYIQSQHDYLIGNYPVERDDGVQLAALQILVEIGHVENHESLPDFSALVEHYLPRELASSRAKTEWEADVIAHYYTIVHLSKDEARQKALCILHTLPYGNSVFYSVRKLEDPIGLLPGQVILGINKRGVHFFRPVPKEYLYSAELRDIVQFGSNDAVVFFKTRVSGKLYIFKFKTKQIIEDMRLKEKRERELKEELHGLKDSLQSEKKKRMDIINERENLRRLLEERESELQTVLVNARKVNLSSDSNQTTVLQEQDKTVRIQNLEAQVEILRTEIRDKSDKLRSREENCKSLTSEKQLLEQKKFRIEENKADEIKRLEAIFEQERQALCNCAAELEKTVTERTEELSMAKSTIALRTSELEALQETMKELEELRDFKEDVDKKVMQTAVILKQQADKITALEKIYKDELILRKKYFNQMEDMKGKIRVYARWRSLNKKEINENQKMVLTAIDEFTLQHPWKDDKPKVFNFDRVFDDTVSQESVFKDTKYLVQSAVDGYNVCLFAYGQTGSGKTFTIYGSEDDPGLTPRAMQELFDLMKRDSKKFAFSIKVYMLELYLDVLVDLLALKNKKPLKLEIKRDMKGMVTVENATFLTVNSLEEMESLIVRGQERRHVAETNMNEESSRSHLILSVVIDSTNLQTQFQTKGKLSFVDLAGSERVKKSGVSGDGMKEAQSINKSLSALGDVISALAGEVQHIPYRNHKLTMLMSDSLGGNAKTLMFVNISPAESNLEETYNSLTYASRVKCIQNYAFKNMTSSKEVAKLKKIIQQMVLDYKGKKIDDVLEDVQDNCSLD
ncbi:kinesin-like protein KIN-14I [Cryptomeria japonica]|uniref:kinesin-like protein KIN-14I n=1 Tax=Cryptomeria japonica TaxID=3369 RepID=UPI0027DA81CE|nr:kinesin-like protein KIN-14I [Cryptomeria japonica]